MLFSPILIPTLIIEPLRYYFSTYGKGAELYWDKDEKKRTIDVSHINDYYKIPLQEKPRVLVDRGSFQISKTGLSDNLAQQKSLKETEGLRDKVNMQIYQGTAIVLVEARNMGTCEILSDMVHHFLTWSRPDICDSQGFKEFAMPMNVSTCSPTDREDTEKFQIQIQVPWIREEHWRVRDDGPILKKLLAETFASPNIRVEEPELIPHM